MGSKTKAPKVAAVAAAPRQSSVDISRAQDESAEELRRRRGFASTQHAGETGAYSAASVLG